MTVSRAKLPTTGRGPRLIELRGDAEARGEQYGRQAADLIDASIEYYALAFERKNGRTWSQMRAKSEAWVELCDRLAPHIMTEMRATARAAGRDVLDLMCLNVRGEVIYDEGARVVPKTDADDHVEGCTSFALHGGAAGDNHVYAGQNWDWRSGVADTLVVLRIVPEEGPTIIMQAEAGQVGRHGANSAGLALNANGLGGRFDSSVGLPQTFLRRLVLEKTIMTDAIDVLVRTTPHIASNLLLAHRDGFSIDLETTPGSMGWVHSEDGLLVHANHYQGGVPPILQDTYRPRMSDSLVRLPRALVGLKLVRGASTSEDVRDRIRLALADHFSYPDSVCTHPREDDAPVDRWETLLSSCVDLTTGEYLFTPGTPCGGEYLSLPWNLYDDTTSVAA